MRQNKRSQVEASSRTPFAIYLSGSTPRYHFKLHGQQRLLFYGRLQEDAPCKTAFDRHFSEVGGATRMYRVAQSNSRSIGTSCAIYPPHFDISIAPSSLTTV